MDEMVTPRGALWIGQKAEDDARLALDPSALLRHVMALGSSGSGKTAFCKVIVEEAVRAGIPAICVDPQGDLASLGAGVLDAAELAARGVEPEIAAELAERAEVVVLTPGSGRGLPLTADPVDGALAELEGAARIAAVSRAAAMVAGLLGFELDSDDGAGIAAVLDRALMELLDGGARPSLLRLTEHLFAAQEGGFAEYARYLDPRKIRVACQRLARLDVGARRALFHDGVPIDVDVLLGRDPRAPVAEGKTRVAVIYLNTLHQQEDKDFFVAALADRLYAWMLANPSPAPQALFYIDEVAPFIPPVRKPACKDGLSLLFKQARKYGVGCLMATQNPGDVDYRAMAQFGTWALGRLTTRQDLKKVEPTVKALAPEQSDAILGRLPSLKPGEMVLLSPDQLGGPVEMRTRWLATRHETWTEERVEEHTAPLRGRFAELLVRSDEPASSVERSPAGSEDGAPASAPSRERSGSEEGPLAPESVERSSASSEEPASAPSMERSRSEERPLAPESVERSLASSEEPASAPSRERSGSKERPLASARVAPAVVDAEKDRGASSGPARTSGRDAEVLAALSACASASAGELSELSGKSEGVVRRALARLVEAGEVRAYAEGRARRYWAVSSGGRPDLGMPARVQVLRANLGEEDAARIAETHARASVLGLLGEDERFERAERAHRLVYKLAFEERVERSALARLFGKRADERVGNVYLHPHTLAVLVFTNADGVGFDDAPRGPASDIRDLDDAAEIELVAPGTLALDESDWTSRQTEEAARESLRVRFDASPGAVTPLFVPLWQLLFRGAKGSLRRVTIDGLIGRVVEWPASPDR